MELFNQNVIIKEVEDKYELTINNEVQSFDNLSELTTYLSAVIRQTCVDVKYADLLDDLPF